MMTQPFKSFTTVSKSDTVNIYTGGKLTDALYVGGAGIVVGVLEDDSTFTFAAVPAGTDFVVLDLPPSAGAIVRGTLAVLPGGEVLAPVQTRALDLVGFSDLVRLVAQHSGVADVTLTTTEALLALLAPTVVQA